MPEFVDKWGKKTATERYGNHNKTFPAPPDQSQPQMPEDKQGPGYDNDTPSSWVTGANEDATGKPGFDKTKR